MQLSAVKLDNYSGFWCVEPIRFNQLVDRINSMNLSAHVAAQEPQTYDPMAQHFESIEGGTIAVIDIQGTMTKAGSSLGGGGTVEARQAIRQAQNDSTVGAIILRFDTPGGNVAGTADLANEVAKTTKPTIAFIEDLCCSAGMWVASQCDEIYANDATAMVGSIGTFMAVYDISGALAEEKIRTIVVKAGEFKGGGFPGMEISEAQVAEWQKVINSIQDQFTAGIARGRKMTTEQAQSLVTGLAYMAPEAVKMKLIDGIKTFDQVVDGLRSKTTLKDAKSMTEKTEPKAATFKEIVTACPGIDPKSAADALFITEQLKAESTAIEANGHYCLALQERLKASQESNGKLTTELTELKATQPKGKGAPAVGTKAKTEGASDTDAKAEFDAAVKAEQAKGKSRSAAVMAVNKSRPELREALVASAN